MGAKREKSKTKICEKITLCSISSFISSSTSTSRISSYSSWKKKRIIGRDVVENNIDSKKQNMPRKQKQISDILKSIYYSPGKSGAFYSAAKLKDILLKERKVKVKEKDIQKWLEGELSYSLHRNRRKYFQETQLLLQELITIGKPTLDF